MPVTIFRLSPIAAVLAALFVPHAACAQPASAPPAQVEGALPEPGLKPAPRLTPPAIPPPDAAGRSPFSTQPPAPTAAQPAARRPPDEGAVFVRADRIEGSAGSAVEASGKVELRTRRETVLADWLPLAVVLMAYDASRGFADGLGMPVHVMPGNHDYVKDTDRKPFEEIFPNMECGPCMLEPALGEILHGPLAER